MTLPLLVLPLFRVSAWTMKKIVTTLPWICLSNWRSEIMRAYGTLGYSDRQQITGQFACAPYTRARTHTLFSVTPVNWTSTRNELKWLQTDHLRSHEIICFHLHHVTHSGKNYTDRACFCLTGPSSHPPGMYAGLRWDLIKLSKWRTKMQKPNYFSLPSHWKWDKCGNGSGPLTQNGVFYEKAILNVDSLQGDAFLGQKK